MAERCVSAECAYYSMGHTVEWCGRTDLLRPEPDLGSLPREAALDLTFLGHRAVTRLVDGFPAARMWVTESLQPVLGGIVQPGADGQPSVTPADLLRWLADRC